MRWWTLLILVALVGGGWLLGSDARRGPTDRVAEYVGAIADRDERGALAAWQLPPWPLPDGRSTTLAERRQAVTMALLAAPPLEFTVLDTEWWNTCCEPHLVPDPAQARFARLRVQLQAQGQAPVVYIFDVAQVGRAGYFPGSHLIPVRWTVQDVYPADQDPLVFRWLREADNRTHALP